MGTSTLLISLFKYRAWVNKELFIELGKLNAVRHKEERHALLRILNHIYVIDRIFAAHLSGEAHLYTATNTPETPSLEALRSAVSVSDRWYVEYVSALAPEVLSESLSFTFTDGSSGRMTREEIIAHVVTHGDYHRGAVGRIMSQLLLSSPDSFAGYLHITEPQRCDRTQPL